MPPVDAVVVVVVSTRPLLDLLAPWLRWFPSRRDGLTLRTSTRSIGTDDAMIVTAASAIPQITRGTPSSAMVTGQSRLSPTLFYQRTGTRTWEVVGP